MTLHVGLWTLDIGMVTRGKQPNTDDSDNAAETSSRREPELQEGVDYYIENALFVFTGEFLLKRGYCCESGCRHCPYQTHQ